MYVVHTFLCTSFRPMLQQLCILLAQLESAATILMSTRVQYAGLPCRGCPLHKLG